MSVLDFFKNSVKAFESLAFFCCRLSSRNEKAERKLVRSSILHSWSLDFWLISFMECHFPSLSISSALSIRLCNEWPRHSLSALWA